MEPDFCTCDAKGFCLWCRIGKTIHAAYGREGIEYLKKCFRDYAAAAHHRIVDEALNSGSGAYKP